jgi:Mrp family chromosome partitioning ATPase
LGANVLLVDADLRRPNVENLLGGEPLGDLSAVLREESDLMEEITHGWIEGLSVLTTQPDPDAGDLLARNFSDVLKQARERFDIVIIDSPPVIATDDARTLSTISSGVILVVSQNSDMRDVSEAVIALEALKAPILGVVANRLREAPKSYYG